MHWGIYYLVDAFIQTSFHLNEQLFLVQLSPLGINPPPTFTHSRCPSEMIQKVLQDLKETAEFFTLVHEQRVHLSVSSWLLPEWVTRRRRSVTWSAVMCHIPCGAPAERPQLGRTWTTYVRLTWSAVSACFCSFVPSYICMSECLGTVPFVCQSELTPGW